MCYSVITALRKFWRKLKCPEERPKLCVAGRKRRRRRKKGRKRKEESTACNKESAGEINRAEGKKNDTAQLAEETKKSTNNRRKVGRETSPETLTTTTITESNLFQKQDRAKRRKRKKKFADKFHEPDKINHTAAKKEEKADVKKQGENRACGDNTGQEGEWITVRRRRKAGRRNSTGDVDLTTMTKSLIGRTSRRHTRSNLSVKPKVSGAKRQSDVMCESVGL